ncbi:MAG: hypothetical protein R3C56_34155 [Pirellulaceae bacterium]
MTNRISKLTWSSRRTVAQQLLAIRLLSDEKRNKQEPQIKDVDEQTTTEFAGLNKGRQHSQWFYFNRNLRLYQGNATYVFKPLSRLRLDTEPSKARCQHDHRRETLS